MSTQTTRILYCHCAYAKVVAPEVKTAVLHGLAHAEVEFDAVPDLCEMAARADPRLRELASEGSLRVAACYPRAVKWLFASAGAPLPEQHVRVWNMRVEPAHTVVEGLTAATVDDDRAALEERGL
ncbi:MAG TPA: hypothetical protein VIX63_11600 [Vicinamibacterales bacterium]